jgi:hypothetical protein
MVKAKLHEPRNRALSSYDWDTIIMGVENIIHDLTLKLNKDEIDFEMLDKAKKCKIKLLVLERKRNAKKKS